MRLRAAILDAPVVVPLAGALAVLIGWAAAGGAQPLTTWGWGALVLLGLLAAAVRAIPLRLSGLPLGARVSLAAMTLYTAWSFASIGWADDRGAALEGADRTLVYLIVLALFIAWRLRPQVAAVLLGAWTLGLGVLAVVGVVRLAGAGAAHDLFAGGSDRLTWPTGYPNGSAALFAMPLWAALALATARDVPWALRGVFAGVAVAFCDLGLLTQSRGALISAPIVLALMFLVLPDRLRRMVTLAPIAAAVAVSVPTILDVGDALDRYGVSPGGALRDASRTVLLEMIGCGVVVAFGALVELRRRPSESRDRRERRRLVRIGRIAFLGTVVVALVAFGDPGQRVDSAWSSFKHGYSENGSGNRLTAGLGSNRYDFYRVALDVFRDHPLAGVGADNFQQQYLAVGRSDETPRYPHSIELRALEQTGLVGAILLLAALGGALAVALPTALRGDPLARAVAAGALGVFAYWLVHGSADWFWEFAGLGAPAFAMLGLAAALGPRPEDHAPARWPLVDAAAPRLAAAVVAVAAVVAIGAPWLAAREARRAGATWAADPGKAYAQLRLARRLNPLSDQPDLLAGSIALRENDLGGADAAFARALARNANGSYAMLERGAIASQRGDGPQALALLERAHALNPRDPLTTFALQVAQAGGRVDVAKLNESILAQASLLAD